MPFRRANITGPAALATVTVALFGITQGIWILLSDAQRWTSPTVAVILQLPGAPWTWAVWSLVGGLLVAVGYIARWWIVKAVGLVSLSIWSATFGVGVIAATLAVPTVPTTGGPTYIALSVLIAVLVNYRATPKADNG